MTMTETNPNKVRSENPALHVTAGAQVDFTDSTEGLETWRNVIRGRVTVKRRDQYGLETTDLIASGRTFELTPDERRANEAAMIIPDGNPFRNGTLQPVILVKDHPDNEAILANPNHLPDDSPDLIFDLKGEAFLERIMLVNNPQAIIRLIELAEEPANHVYVVQLRWLERRLKTLVPPVDNVKPESTGVGTASGPARDRQTINPVSTS